MSGARTGATALGRDRASCVVALAASAGGLAALGAVLSRIPADFPGAVVVLQHLAARHPSLLVHLLGSSSPLPVQEAADGDQLSPGHVYVAPPGRHLTVQAHGVLALRDTAPVHFVRPSADVLFASLAAAVGPHAIAVVLSGRGEDGAAGAVAVRNAGGTVLAEDAATARCFDMPAAAIKTGAVSRVLPVDQIADALVALVRTGDGGEHA